MPAPDDIPPPLPREWLPRPVPAEGDARWESQVARIMAEAEPVLAEIGHRRPARELDWWSALGWWLRPAAAAALVAVAALVALGRAADAPRPASESVTLGVLAAPDDPAVLWESLGIEADPVLALIAWQEGSR